MEKSMLIIGEGSTHYGLNKIIKQDSKKTVAGLYGETSELTLAFNLAKAIGVKEIYLANAQTKNSQIDIVLLSRQYNFSYIVPIGVKFSDTAFNTQLNRTMTFAEIFLKSIAITSDSIVVMTDNHASLYQNIDHYLIDMKSKIAHFKIEAQNCLENGRQLWLVANHLKEVPYSNVVLTAIMCITKTPSYPDYPIPEALFEIDTTDILEDELIFFKNNHFVNNSIENFINFHNEYNAYKIAPIDSVIRQINSEIDLSSFSGKMFTNQTRLKIQSLIQDYLSSIKGHLIRDYKIMKIDSFLENDYSYVIVVYFKILPMNSLEECDVVIEV